MIAELAIAVPIAMGLAGFGYRTYSRRQNNQEGRIKENTNTCNEIKLDIATIQADVGHIKGEISESKYTQEKIFGKIDELNREVLNRIGSQTNPL